MSETPTMTRFADVCKPFEPRSANQHFLSVEQLSPDSFRWLLRETETAEMALGNGGIDLLPRNVVKAVMRQPSTRTGGSLTTSAVKLGAAGHLYSGMESSSEAKGELTRDSMIALAAQADVLGLRTAEDFGPHEAAQAIDAAVGLTMGTSVINLGDGTNEHPTQAVGDMYTILKKFGSFDGLQIGFVGDHLRYRAFHSGMFAAGTLLSMKVYAVAADCAPVPDYLADTLGNRLTVVGPEYLNDVMRTVDVLYVGRNPDEYTGEDAEEQARRQALAEVYKTWRVDNERIAKHMDPEAIVMHPRPFGSELVIEGDCPQMYDIGQMQNMIPARMAVLAACKGVSIAAALAAQDEWRAPMKETL